jgi:transposase
MLFNYQTFLSGVVPKKWTRAKRQKLYLAEQESEMASKTKRQYTEEFKRETVGLIKSSGKSQAQVARELGISDQNISRWWQEYGQENAMEETRSVSKEAYKAMQAELRRVTEERDILKKALNIFSRSG